MIFRNSPTKKKTSLKLLIDECSKRVWNCLWRKSWRMAATGCVAHCRPLYDMHTSLVLLQNKEVNKEWQGWDRGGGMTYCLITCQVGVQHSHITIIQGAVIRRNLHKQTKKQTWSTCQTQIPWTDLVHESLSNLWHVIKEQKKIFWIINGLLLTHTVTTVLTRAFCRLSDTLMLSNRITRWLHQILIHPFIVYKAKLGHTIPVFFPPFLPHKTKKWIWNIQYVTQLQMVLKHMVSYPWTANSMLWNNWGVRQWITLVN